MIVGAVDNGLYNGSQFIAQENGNDGRGCFMSAQTVIITGGGHSRAQELLILINALNKGRKEYEELGVLPGRLTGTEKVFACIGAKGPVVVLTGAVYTLERLFVQQTYQIVLRWK